MGGEEGNSQYAPLGVPMYPEDVSRWSEDHQRRDWEAPIGPSSSFCFHPSHLLKTFLILHSNFRASCRAATTSSGWGNFSFRGGPFFIPVQSSVSFSPSTRVISKLFLRGFSGLRTTVSPGWAARRADLTSPALRPYTRQLLQCSMTTLWPSWPPSASPAASAAGSADGFSTTSSSTGASALRFLPRRPVVFV